MLKFGIGTDAATAGQTTAAAGTGASSA